MTFRNNADTPDATIRQVIDWANSPPKPDVDIRWLCYARAHGKTPREMEDHDRAIAPPTEFPAPNMIDGAWLKPYGAWLHPLWDEFMETLPDDDDEGVSLGGGIVVQPEHVHDQFDAWLARRFLAK